MIVSILRRIGFISSMNVCFKPLLPGDAATALSRELAGSLLSSLHYEEAPMANVTRCHHRSQPHQGRCHRAFKAAARRSRPISRGRIRPGNYPGIVVIQEAFGLVDHICEPGAALREYRLQRGRSGALLARGAPKDPDVMEQVFRGHVRPADSEAVQDLEAAADYLNAMPGATGKGRRDRLLLRRPHTLLFACSSNKVNAAIDCWAASSSAPPPTPKRPRRARRRPLTWSGNCIVRCSACSAKRTRTRRSRSKPS